MKITIPGRLQELLEESPLRGASLSAVASLEPWFQHSGTPFFRDYTDHGPQHISEVLETCVGLVQPRAWESLSGNDAAVLVLAVVLHDAANHLQEDGFLALVRPQAAWPRITELDPNSWTELWNRYLTGTRRWKPEQRRILLGSDALVQSPDLDFPEQWTRAQCDVIGEFLRRHHPRLAHEIARFGVPGPSANPLGLTGLPEDLRDLVGFVARSHGMALRPALNYVEKYYHRRSWKDVHTPFLMVLLRVADYLQIQASRAPEEILKVKRLRSPTSCREWKVHHAIGNITSDSPDPEAIEIQVLPDKVDLQVTLRILEWLKGIQHELDESWAVLGEVYGEARRGLDRLGLSLRRVRSNLDDLAAFEERIDFVPKETRLRIAGTELVRLLSRPLYGDSPEIAIRELIQNSVDAVWELRTYCQRQGIDINSLTFAEHDPHVLICVNQIGEESWRLTVSDKGIGMTVDTIMNYFLTIGQSYRRSEEWSDLFQDERGGSLVPRTGKFGIGVLAAFLLDDQDHVAVHVKTRHIDSPRGLSFTFKLGEGLITLRHCQRPVGSLIEIFTCAEPILTSGWYHLSDPAVEIRDAEGEALVPRLQIPSRDEMPRPPWRRSFLDRFESIDWCADRGNPNRLRGQIFCNGLKIPDGYRMTEEGALLLLAKKPISKQSIYSIIDDVEPHLLEPPMLSVFDSDAVLEVTLDRSAIINGHIPFEAELADDLRRNIIAFYLVRTPRDPFWVCPSACLKLAPPLARKISIFNFYSRKGFGLAMPGNFSKLGKCRVFLAEDAEIEDLAYILKKDSEGIILGTEFSYSFYNPDYEYSTSKYLIESWLSGSVRGEEVAVKGVCAFDSARILRALVRKSWMEIVAESRAEDDAFWQEYGDSPSGPIKWNAELRTAGKNVMIDTGLPAGETSPLEAYFSELTKTGTEAPKSGVVECYVHPNENASMNSPLEIYWDRYIRQPIIPFDPEHRRAELRHAFEHPDLRPHIEYWEAMPQEV